MATDTKPRSNYLIRKLMSMKCDVSIIGDNWTLLDDAEKQALFELHESLTNIVGWVKEKQKTE